MMKVYSVASETLHNIVIVGYCKMQTYNIILINTVPSDTFTFQIVVIEILKVSTNDDIFRDRLNP